jgi:ArsR family transcriptional regulator
MDTRIAFEHQERRVNQSLHQFKAEFFKALAHPVRIDILEKLRSGEQCVNDLQLALGIDQSMVSQQLALLRGRNIVESRKAGTSVYYRVRDPLIFQLLDGAREIFNNQLISTQELLQQLAQDVAAL